MTGFGYLMLIPEDSITKFKEVLSDEEDVLIFRPDSFKKVCKDYFDECSVADVSNDAYGSLGQG